MLSYPGHAGRPGKRGGSLPRGGIGSIPSKPVLETKHMPVQITGMGNIKDIHAEVKSIEQGEPVKVSTEAARVYLLSKKTVKTILGKEVSWKPRIYEKYVDGEGKSEGADPSRLKHISMAVRTLKEGQVWRSPTKTMNTYQHHYFKEFGKNGVIVFVGEDSGLINGFIYSKTKDLKKKLHGTRIK